MKNRFLLGIGILAFSATSILGIQIAQSPGGTIQGTITRAGTSEAIPDVNVLVTNGRVGARGQLAPSIEQTVNAAIARGVAIPPDIQAQLDAERARNAAGTNVQLTTKTDRNGRFFVRDLPPGQFTVQVEREGFFGPPTIGTMGTGNYALFVNRNVTVEAGRATPEMTFSLVPGSAVSGRVADSEGRPIVGAAVQAFQLVYQNGSPILQSTASADTDDRGDYRLFRIPPGDYYFSVTPGQTITARGFGGGGGFGGGRGRGVITPSGDALVRTFHPDASDASSARLLHLRGGEELSGITISARRSPMIKVSGQVSSSMTLPVQTNARGQSNTVPVRLFLVSRGQNGPEEPNAPSLMSVSMDAPTSGKFEIPGLIPGSYDLYAIAPNPVTDPAASTASIQPRSFVGRTSFEAGFQDITGLAVVIRPGVEVKTYVTVDGSPAAAANNIRVLLNPGDRAQRLAGVLGRGGPVAAGIDGMATIPFLSEGLYRFQVNITPGRAPARGQRGAANTLTLRDAYVEDIREGGLSVYDNGLLVGKEPPRQTEVVIKTNGGGIVGTVYDAQQQPKAGATVVLVPPDSRRQNIALYKSATSDDKGQFGMIAVPPGRYKLFAWESIPAGAYQNAEFISKYEVRGTSINVNPSSTTTAQVSVIPPDR